MPDLLTTLVPNQTKIVIVANTNSHQHPIRLLKNYFSKFEVQIIDETAKDEIEKQSKSGSFLIWCSESKTDQSGHFKDITNIKHASSSQEYHHTILQLLLGSNDSHWQPKDLNEGAFQLKTISKDKTSILIARGGNVAGIIYAIDEFINQILKGFFAVPKLDLYQVPSSHYRNFFTWDFSTNWFFEQHGKQEIGFANPYLKPEGGFLKDYKMVVDFMSANRLNGLIIYGFLRDSHGGIETAQELCRYAKERGVRIIPGVGINAYGAVYWEGNHRYNLSNWLEKNPHLSATFEKPSVFELADFGKIFVPKTHYLDAACPSKPQNAAFHVEAIQWLAETFDIGGINFETGDYGTCQCKDCLSRREKNKQWSHEDMGCLYPKLFSAARLSKPDLWLICEAYWDNLLNLEALEPLKKVPGDAIFQYCFNRSYWKKLKTELTAEHVAKLPHSTNIFRTHMGSQWHTNERIKLTAKEFSEITTLAHKTGMQGATIFAEEGPFQVTNEIKYLAFARFGFNAKLSWDQFIANDLVPRLGGIEQAKRYLDLASQTEEGNDLEPAIDEAREIGKSTTGEVYRRWVWLQNRLFQAQNMSVQNKPIFSEGAGLSNPAMDTGKGLRHPSKDKGDDLAFKAHAKDNQAKRRLNMRGTKVAIGVQKPFQPTFQRFQQVSPQRRLLNPKVGEIPQKDLLNPNVGKIPQKDLLNRNEGCFFQKGLSLTWNIERISNNVLPHRNISRFQQNGMLGSEMSKKSLAFRISKYLRLVPK